MQHIQSRSAFVYVDKPLPSSPTILTTYSSTASQNSLDTHSNLEWSFRVNDLNNIGSFHNQSPIFKPTTLSATAYAHNKSNTTISNQRLKQEFNTGLVNGLQRSGNRSAHEAISSTGSSRALKLVNPQESFFAKSMNPRSIFDTIENKSSQSILRPVKFYPQGRLIDLPTHRKRKLFPLKNLFKRSNVRAHASLPTDVPQNKNIPLFRPARPARPPRHLCPSPHRKPFDIDYAEVCHSDVHIAPSDLNVANTMEENRIHTTDPSGGLVTNGSSGINQSDREGTTVNSREEQGLSLRSVRPEDSISRQGSVVGVNFSIPPADSYITCHQVKYRNEQNCAKSPRRFVGRNTIVDCTPGRPHSHGKLDRLQSNSHICSCSNHVLKANKSTEYSNEALESLPHTSLRVSQNGCSPHDWNHKVTDDIVFGIDQSILDDHFELQRQRVREIGNRLRERYKREWEESQKLKAIDGAGLLQSPTSTLPDSGYMSQDVYNSEPSRRPIPQFWSRRGSHGDDIYDEVPSNAFWNKELQLKSVLSKGLKLARDPFGDDNTVCKGSQSSRSWESDKQTKGREHISFVQDCSITNKATQYQTTVNDQIHGEQRSNQSSQCYQDFASGSVGQPKPAESSTPGLTISTPGTSWDLRRVRSALRASSTMLDIVEQRSCVSVGAPRSCSSMDQEGHLRAGVDHLEPNASTDELRLSGDDQMPPEIPEQSQFRLLRFQPGSQPGSCKVAYHANPGDSILSDRHRQMFVHSDKTLQSDKTSMRNLQRRMESSLSLIHPGQLGPVVINHTLQSSDEGTASDECKRYSISTNSELFF